MKILDRYIGLAIVQTTLIILAGLIALFSVVSLIEELGRAGQANYGVLQAVTYTLLNVPEHGYELLPIAAIVGSLVALSILARSGELTVVRSAGVSAARILVSALKASLMLAALVIVLGEFLAPPAAQYARHLRSVALTNQIYLNTRYGYWTRDGQSFINIRTVLPEDRLQDVYIYEFDDANRLRTSTFASTAHYSEGQWVLEDLEQTSFGADGITKRRLGGAKWETSLRPDMINVVVVKPKNLSAWQLVDYIRYLKENAQESVRYEQALWAKITQPIATGIMVLLAVPIVLISLQRLSLSRQVLIGTLVGIAFHIANQVSGHLGIVYNVGASLSASIPTLIVIAATWALMRRA
ncbi:MAG: LPS export ABC transporter permease LptG [Gammaproteobacteria bacterium]|nr:LPS export ABC transporter permease LptG [Gammaproteobacteria bacterium]